MKRGLLGACVGLVLVVLAIFVPSSDRDAGDAEGESSAPPATSRRTPVEVTEGDGDARGSTADLTVTDAGARAAFLEPPNRAKLHVTVLSLESRKRLGGVRVHLSIPWTAEEWDAEAWDALSWRERREYQERLWRSRNDELLPGWSGVPGQVAVTEHDGTTAFRVPEGLNLHLEVWGDGRNVGVDELDVHPLTAGEERKVTIELPTTQEDLHVAGRVIDSSGRPIEGVEVRVVDHLREWSRPVIETHRTLAGGGFDFRLADWRSLAVEFHHPRYFSVIKAPRWWRGFATRNVVLEEEAWLRVYVNRFEEPLAGVSVRLRESYHGPGPARYPFAVPSPRELEAVTREDGSTTFFDIEPGARYQLEVFEGEQRVHREEGVRLDAGQVLPHSVYLDQGGVISGRLVDPYGIEVPDREVWLLEATEARPRLFQPGERLDGRVRTDEEGWFKFEGVPRGAWWIGPGHVPHDEGQGAMAPVGEVIKLGARERREIVLHGSPGLYVTGRVLDPEGNPVPFVEVRGVLESHLGAVSSVANAEGDYRLGPLPEGQLTLDAGARWGALLHENGSDPGIEVQVPSRFVDLTVILTGAIKGQVIDGETQEPIAANVYLLLTPHWFGQPKVNRGFSKPPPLFGATSVHTEDGEFRASALPFMYYDVVARTSDGRIGVRPRVPVSPGADPGKVVVPVYSRGAAEGDALHWVRGTWVAEGFLERRE